MKILKLTQAETQAVKDFLNFGLEENEKENLPPVKNLLGEQVFNSNKELIRGVIKRLEEEEEREYKKGRKW